MKNQLEYICEGKVKGKNVAHSKHNAPTHFGGGREMRPTLNENQRIRGLP